MKTWIYSAFMGAVCVAWRPAYGRNAASHRESQADILATPLRFFLFSLVGSLHW